MVDIWYHLSGCIFGSLVGGEMVVFSCYNWPDIINILLPHSCSTTQAIPNVLFAGAILICSSQVHIHVPFTFAVRINKVHSNNTQGHGFDSRVLYAEVGWSANEFC
jgi:hypothetical protein